MERGSKEENDEIVGLSDAILNRIADYAPVMPFTIALSAVSDAMIYICQSVRIERIEFKNICQQLVNQYDEIFIRDDAENS